MAIVLGSPFKHVPTYPMPTHQQQRPRQPQIISGRQDLVPEHQAGSLANAQALEAQRNADMVNRHMQMQGFDLSIAEHKRMQKLQNGLAAIDEANKNGTLTDQEANHLRFQVKTQIDPMKLKIAQANVAKTQMQTDLIRHQAEAAALANVNQKALMAQYGHNGMLSIQHSDGKTRDYAFDQHGKMFQIGEDKGKAATKEQTASQSLADTIAKVKASNPDWIAKSPQQLAEDKNFGKAAKAYHDRKFFTEAGEGGEKGALAGFLQPGQATASEQPPGEMPQAGAPAQPPQNAPPAGQTYQGQEIPFTGAPITPEALANAPPAIQKTTPQGQKPPVSMNPLDVRPGSLAGKFTDWVAGLFD